MNANELMIGDWVNGWDGRWHPVCVSTISSYPEHRPTIVACGGYGYSLVDQVQPIQLTTEILEKSGFEPIRQDAGEPYYWQFFDKEEGHVINAFRRIYRGLWIECSNATTETSVNKQCEYVHELQHALRLAGIKKEIVL